MIFITNLLFRAFAGAPDNLLPSRPGGEEAAHNAGVTVEGKKENVKRQTSKRGVANDSGKRQTANDKRQTTNDKRQTTEGALCRLSFDVCRFRRRR
jgi:hypothetical protein